MELMQRSLFDDCETETTPEVTDPVYVDHEEGDSHLFVDPETPLDVLHTFAASLNLPGSAYKTKGAAIPHYGLKQRQRDQAIAQGAVYCDPSEVKRKTKAWKLPPIGISTTVSVNHFVRNSRHVRRTFGFKNLKPGDLMKAAVRTQGQLGVTTKIIRVVSVRTETLSKMEHEPDYGRQEARLEGFPQMSGAEFVSCFCRRFKVVPATPVTRIEFTYV